jgi:hypothetical protein
MNPLRCQWRRLLTADRKQGRFSSWWGCLGLPRKLGHHERRPAALAVLTVDSTFTNTELASLASELKGLGSSAGSYVTAPSPGTGMLRPR